MNLGIALAKRRATLGFSQKELALKAGVPLQTVIEAESGELDLDLLKLRRLCQALDIKISSIFRAECSPDTGGGPIIEDEEQTGSG